MTKQPFNPDTLADHLDQLIPPDQTETISYQRADDPLVESAVRLANARHPQLSEEAFNRIQQEMLAAKTPRQMRYFPNAVGYLAVAASIMLVLIFMMPTIGRSVPGEVLYPVKRALERVELTSATLLQNETQIRINQAERRANEAVVLIDEGQFAPDLIDETLDQIGAVIGQVESDQVDHLIPQLNRINADLGYVVAKSQTENLASDVVVATFSARLQSMRAQNPALFTVPDTPAIEPSATPTHTPTMTRTAEATATETQSPTHTAAASQTNTVIPSQTPSSTASVTPRPEFSATPQPPGYVMGDGVVNVREGPGTDFPIIATARPGEPITVLASTEGDWINVRLANGAEGWIASFLVHIGDAPPPQTPIPAIPDGGDPDEDGGRPEDAGPPQDPGPPDDVGPPDNAGPPQDPGPPPGAGPPDDVGPPAGQGGN